MVPHKIYLKRKKKKKKKSLHTLANTLNTNDLIENKAYNFILKEYLAFYF